MRLKKLILHGFKSFADRVEFVFDSPITGIVGPNGCGKSNVVDAFKWVLGEQSAKSLRGEAMLDVIFNGSGGGAGGRKPAGMAEVTLVFENPLRQDNTRLLNLDTDEVSVGRRLYRDGTSEYTMNNQTSRLKDIRELFLDTGVGVDAYSVIEQGRVAALLEANPAERRQIFEEAAGISKFKVKKKEAQRKLEKVDANLVRVHDIVEEVERRLRSVKIQAGRARTYQEYSTRLTELRLTYAIQEYHTHYTQLTDLQARRDDAQFRVDDLAQDLSRAQNELAEKRQQFEAVTQQRQGAEYELVQARAAMQSAQQRQQYAEHQLQQIAEQLATFEQDRSAAEEKLSAATTSLATESETLERLTRELEEHRSQIDQRQQQFRDGQLQLNEIAQEIERNKTAILDLMRKLASTNSRLGAIEIERKNVAAQQQRIADRRRVVVEELESLETQRNEAQQKLDETLAIIAERTEQMETRRADAANLGKQITSVGEQLGAAKEHRSGLISRQKLLKDLEANREGVSEGVKSVLRERETRFPFIRGLVADVLRVDVEHAHVIEAALDGRDQWLVATDATSAAAAREHFEDLEGRVNILSGETWEFLSSTDYPVGPTIEATDQHGLAARATEEAVIDEISRTGVSPVPVEISVVAETEEHGRDAHGTDSELPAYDWNQHPHRIRMAIDLVRFEPNDSVLARRLLDTTIVVDDLAVALDLHKTGPAGYRYVTHAGEVVEADGTLRAGPLSAAMGLLSRHAELEALALQIEEVDRRIEFLADQLNQGNAQARAIEEAINGLRTEVYAFNTQKVELTSSLAQVNDRQTALRREQPVLEKELNAFLDQVGRLKSEEASLAEQRTALERDQAARQQLIEELAAKQQTIADNLKIWGEELTGARVALGQIQEKQLASRELVQRHTAQQGELQEQIDRLIRSSEAVQQRRVSVEGELESARAAEAELIEKQERLASRVEDLSGQVESLSGVVRELSTQVDSLRENHASIEQELHKLQLLTSEHTVRLETLVSRTQEELQLDLPARYAEYFVPRRIEDEAGEIREEPGGYVPADMDWDAVAAEIKELREKVQRLGNVNLDSLSEQEELEQRQQFLSTQVTDLTNSKQQLEEMIDHLNRESGLRFEQTFNAVREHFQGMFRKLFGGGKADVFLKLEEDDKDADQQPVIGPDGQAVLPVMRKTIDPLEAGIEIMAHPPGKKPATISQLSGGEKAMTCIALLMSIFKSKPSPFCILDEVDAPLDEANNQRFGLIIQEFLELSQFIVITHHKRTMQICDVLYGVTMQEQGVSKRVAVKFDQVDNQGRISADAMKNEEAHAAA